MAQAFEIPECYQAVKNTATGNPLIFSVNSVPSVANYFF